jgi:hypothetical protein
MTTLEMLEAFDKNRYILLGFLLAAPFVLPFPGIWEIALACGSSYVLVRDLLIHFIF